MAAFARALVTLPCTLLAADETSSAKDTGDSYVCHYDRTATDGLLALMIAGVMVGGVQRKSRIARGHVLAARRLA